MSKKPPMSDEEWFEQFAGNRNSYEFNQQPKGFATTTPTGSSYNYSGQKSDNYKLAPRCFESHPPLPLGKGLQIFGGSCGSPKVTDADIYIGFDSFMKPSPKRFPWTSGYEIAFAISDGRVPTDTVNFKKLVSWTAEQLQAGAKVHCGCIGGHGRTGLFLSALVFEMMGEKNAIEYVRTNYCKKAVETTEQINWLKDEYGITPVKGSKIDMFKDEKSKGGAMTVVKRQLPLNFVAKPIPNKTCLWGPKAL